MWALLAALSWGFAPMFEKFGLAKIPVMTGLFYRCIGVVVGLVFLVIFNSSAIKNSLATGVDGWWYLVLGGFMASIVGQIFFYHALKGGEISQVVPIGAAYPLISFILGLIFLGEKFTLAKAGGLACVMVGVVLLK